MAVSTNKKVLVRRFQRESLQGFVNPQTSQQPEGLELLSVTGTVQLVPYSELKAVYFVRDFIDGEPPPEQRLFQTRPKANGIWVRMKFRDGELMDGMLLNNLLQLEPYGFTIVPPNAHSNTQRVFVPKAALLDLQVVGVIGSPLRPKKAKPKPKEQIELFE